MASSTVGRIPVNPGAKFDDPLLAVFVKQVALGTPTSNRAEMSAMWTPLSKAINAVTSGGKEIDTVVKDTQDTVSKAIDKLQGAPTETPTSISSQG